MTVSSADRGARLIAALRAAPWSVDVAAVVVCAAFSVAYTVAGPLGAVETGPWWWVDLLGGLLTSVALLAERTALLPTAVFVLVVGCVATTTAPAVAVLLFLVGLRRTVRTAVVLVVLTVLTGLLVHQVRMIEGGAVELVRTALVTVSVWSIVAASGAALRIRGRLLDSLRAQAETAQRRAEERERTRIAREMHDVVAHRISLLAMQAGALSRSSRLTEDGLRSGIDEIACTARDALEDMHDVLRVLRRPDDGPSPDPERPQPLLSDLPDLVATMRAAGQVIESRIELPADEVPPTPGRTVYRVAQEALANAAKHAPGATVDLTLDVPRPRVLHLVVTNTVHSGPGRAAAAGSGTGLVGLRERVELAGGTILHCGIDPGATPQAFRVEVSVPWTR